MTRRALNALAFVLVTVAAITSVAQEVAAEAATGSSASFDWVAAVIALAAVPLALAMLTAFVKVVVVLGILKSALGLQSVPPLPIVLGLGIVLTIVIMAPVAVEMADEVRGALATMEHEDDGGAGVVTGEWEVVSTVANAAMGPLGAFLDEQAHASEVALFAELTGRDVVSDEVTTDDLLVLAPAFVISELKEAFMIGFLLFVPFLILDLVVANVLLSLGMHMLSPTTVSLPFKLLLFVMVDGWHLLAHGLITSYQLA